MSNKGFANIIFVAIAAILVVGGAAYIIFSNTQIPKTEPPTATTTTVSVPPIANSVATDTALTLPIPGDWKTYQNNQYGFEFKYPPEASVAADRTYSVNSIATYFVVAKGLFNQILFVYGKPENQSLKEWYQSNFSGVRPVTGPFEKVINGYNGLEVTNPYPGFYRKSLFLEKNNLIVEIPFDINSLDENISSDNQNFLSTFKFIDVGLASSGGLKTYSDSLYGFSFQYPKDMTLDEMHNTIQFPDSFYSLPNSAKTTIRISATDVDLETCKGVSRSVRGDFLATVETVGGNTMYHTVSGDCGAGTCGEEDRYAGYHNNGCYSFTAVTMTGNPDALFDGTNQDYITQIEKNNTINKTNATAVFRQILSTLQFKNP